MFAMNKAKNSKAGQILAMEGYMDVISLHQSGFDNAVASLGTAFTPQQAELIKRYSDKVVLCYDADEAGQKATDRAGEILREADIKTKVLKITDGKDPDEYIKVKGAEMFQLLVENAESFIEYKVHTIEKKFNLEDPVAKIEFVEQVAKVMAGIKSDVEREVYIKRCARNLDISPQSIQAQVDDYLRKKKMFDRNRDIRQEKRDFESRTGGRSDLDKMRLYNAEKLLLNLICEKEIFREVKDKLSPEDFSEGLHQRLAKIIFDTLNNGEKLNPVKVISQFDENDLGMVSEILSDDKNVDNKAEAVKMPLKIVLDYKTKKADAATAQGGDAAKLQEIMDRLKKEKK